MIEKLKHAWYTLLAWLLIAGAAALFLGFLALLWWLDRVRFVL
jgi:hypothetical protein